MDPLASKERRETEVCPGLKVLLVARATVVSLEPVVLLVPQAHLVCPVLKVPKEPRVQVVLLVQKETLVQSVLLVLLAHQVKLSSLCQFSHQRRQSARVISSQMVPSWIMARVWRTFLAPSTTSSKILNA